MSRSEIRYRLDSTAATHAPEKLDDSQMAIRKTGGSVTFGMRSDDGHVVNRSDDDFPTLEHVRLTHVRMDTVEGGAAARSMRNFGPMNPPLWPRGSAQASAPWLLRLPRQLSSSPRACGCRLAPRSKVQ